MAEVKRLDTGGDDIMISGQTREDVEAALQDLVDRGGKVITPLSQVGRTWVAACSAPPKVEDIDRTSTLDLRQIEAAQRKRRPEAALCQVEEAGLKRIITGPSYDAVHAKLAELLEAGASLVSHPEESFGSWIAVCDTGAGTKPR
jgi:predicted enzyme related to lactoylglutathione lyase